jgi:hypothetical protein
MRCQCSNVADALYLEEAPKGFRDTLVQQDMQNWMRLFQCSQCGALWAIDEWDKYQWQVAFRVQVREAWASVDREPQRKQLLLRSRGGITAEPCIWASCQNRRVNGVVYCVDHLYATGARK